MLSVTNVTVKGDKQSQTIPIPAEFDNSPAEKAVPQKRFIKLLLPHPVPPIISTKSTSQYVPVFDITVANSEDTPKEAVSSHAVYVIQFMQLIINILAYNNTIFAFENQLA
jgi:hypothetical protein